MASNSNTPIPNGNARDILSYENFGTALAWFDNATENTKRRECDTPLDTFQVKNRDGVHRLFAQWEERASVPKVDVLGEKLREGARTVLHICLTPRSDKITVGPSLATKCMQNAPQYFLQCHT